MPINVDYPNLRRTLEAVGAPEDNSELEIEYGANKPKDDALSLYFNEDKRVVVGITPGKVAESQEVLEHELQHYSDDVNLGAYDDDGKFGGAVHDRMYDLALGHGRKLIKRSLIGLGSVGAINAPTSFMKTPAGMSPETFDSLAGHLDHATYGAMAVVLGATALMGVYQADKFERRARKASKRISLPSTITIDTSDS